MSLPAVASRRKTVGVASIDSGCAAVVAPLSRRAVPCRAVPCRAVPCRAVPCRGEARRVESPSHAARPSRVCLAAQRTTSSHHRARCPPCALSPRAVSPPLPRPGRRPGRPRGTSPTPALCHSCDLGEWWLAVNRFASGFGGARGRHAAGSRVWRVVVRGEPPLSTHPLVGGRDRLGCATPRRPRRPGVGCRGAVRALDAGVPSAARLLGCCVDWCCLSWGSTSPQRSRARRSGRDLGQLARVTPGVCGGRRPGLGFAGPAPPCGFGPTAA
jgi:hypothetical protein